MLALATEKLCYEKGWKQTSTMLLYFILCTASINYLASSATIPANCVGELDGLTCTCGSRIGDASAGGWDVECSDLKTKQRVLFIDISINKLVETECLDRHFSPYQKAMYRHLNISDIKRFHFIYCPLPNISFAEILDGMNVTKLKFGNSENAQNIDASLFQGLHNLEQLDIGKNGIRELPSDIFQGLLNLKSLFLVDNNLETIPAELFQNTSNLTNLFLGNNHLRQLPDKVFINLTHLQRLYLTKNKLNKLTNETFEGLQSLKVLDISENLLTVLPEDLLKSTTNLVSLRIKSNKLKFLPENLFNYTSKLQELDISQNSDLGYLPEGLLQGLNALENISLSDCNLTTIPPSFFEPAQNLKVVKIFRNQILELAPNLFTSNQHLLNVNINSNLLKTLPPELFHKQYKLEELWLSKNNLEELPEGMFSNLVNLKRLSLSFNSLKSLYKDMLEHNQMLHELDLSHNKIEALNGFNPFGLTPNLEFVDVSHNAIKEIPYLNWSIFSSLKKVIFEYNNITNFSVPVLYSTKVEMFLGNNQITFIDVSEIKTDIMVRSSDPEVSKIDERSVHIFYFGNNPLNCDCKLLDFVQLGKNSIKYGPGRMVRFSSKNLKCQMPLELAGQEPFEIAEERFVCPIYDNCSESCQCHFRGYDSTVIVNCKGRGLTSLPKTVPANTSVLYFQGNSLDTMNGLSDPMWRNLTELYLDSNAIQFVENWQLPHNLIHLSLRNNRIQRLSDDVMNYTQHKMNFQIKLGGNEWICDCSALPLKTWLLENVQKIGDINDVYCQNAFNEIGNESVLLVKVPDDILCPPDTSAQQLQLTIITSICVILAILLFIVSVLYYRNKQTVIAYMYIHLHNVFVCFFSEEDIDEEKVFDAFVSYSNADREVAFALLNELEVNSDPPFKLCIHERDWIPGNMISWNIVNSVQNSRRTILILSKDFLQSVWFQVEFHTAYYQMLEDKIDRLIVIVCGELPPKDSMDKDLHFLLTTKTYLVWGERWFWEKLRYAMPHKKHVLPLDNKLPLRSRPNGSVLKTIDQQINNYALSTAPSQTREEENSDNNKQLQKHPLDRCNSTTESTAQLVINEASISTACL